MNMDVIFNKWKKKDLMGQIKEYMKLKIEPDQKDLVQMLLSGFQSLKLLIYIVEVSDGKCIYSFANKPGIEILRTDQTLIGKTFEDVLSKKSAIFLKQQYIHCATSKEEIYFENELELQNGDKRIHETILTPFFEQGKTYIFAVVQDVTEKKSQLNSIIQSKKRLEENEQRLHSLVENNLDAIFMFNKDGYFIEMNKSMEDITGYKASHLIGKRFSKLLITKDFEKVQRNFELALQGKPISYETTIYHKEGHEVMLEVTNVPIFVDGQITEVYGIAKDITLVKKTLEELTQQEMRFKSYVRNVSDYIIMTDKNKKVQYMNDAFKEIFGYTEQEVLGKEIPVIPDWLKVETDELYEQVLQGKKMQNIQVQGQHKSGDLIDISLTLCPIYDELGNIIGMSSTGRDITEAKKSELTLKKEKQELESFWNYSTNSLCLIDYDGRIHRINPAFEMMFGIGMEENRNLTLATIQPEKINNQMQSLLTRLREVNHPIYSRTKQQRMDGSLFNVEVTYVPIREGNILALVIYNDVTETTQMIEELKSSEEIYRNIVETIPEAMLIHQEGKVIYINKLGLDLLHAKSSSQVIGKDILDFVHPNDHQKLLQRIKNAEQRLHHVDQNEQKFLTLDGDTFYADATTVSFLIDGSTSLLVSLRDITARRRAEKLMKESEERFRIIAENSLDIIKILDPKGTIMYTSPAVEFTLGYPVRKFIGNSFVDLIHPDDVKTVRQQFANILESKQNVEINVRRIHKDGYSLWLHSYLIPIISPDGEIEKIVVISRDITEDRRREERLSRMAFYDELTGLPNRRLFNDRLEQAMFTTDRTGRQTALMVLDCDKFKNINDTLGHDVGDEVIKEFARRIRLSLRKTDTISRVGGDEFTVVLPELKNELEAIDVGNRILENVSEPMRIHGHQLEITASIGLSFYPIEGQDSSRLFKEADENLYKAKDRGGNTLFTNVY